MKTTQPRIAKIERAASDVSMDQLIRAFTAAGGKLVIRTSKAKVKRKRDSASARSSVVLKAVMTKRVGK